NGQPELNPMRLMASVPPVTQKSFLSINNESIQRQPILKYLAFFFVGLLFGFIGYYQLYIVRPIFGANAWIDYFSLFIWGFCAEVTLSPIFLLIRR
ncbi:hypothetical protein JW964_15580, partial [candidate division KSB1 bacterium]|nr:hypothetical protein [candidate division KSB1 bacterium]